MPSPARSQRYGIVVSRFNREITESLLRGALRAFGAKGIPRSRVEVRWVPGAFELPVAALELAKSRRCQAVVALGCILKGQTPQYRYLAQATFEGLALAGVLTGVPVTCGVIVAREYRHARARAAGNGMNRGQEAAEAAWEMAHAR